MVLSLYGTCMGLCDERRLPDRNPKDSMRWTVFVEHKGKYKYSTRNNVLSQPNYAGGRPPGNSSSARSDLTIAFSSAPCGQKHTFIYSLVVLNQAQSL